MKLFVDTTLFLFLLPAVASLKAVGNHDASRGQSSLRAGSRRTQDDCESVLDIICKLQNTRTFCEMVKTVTDENALLLDGISGGSPYTVFAPTDTAFEQTPQLEELSSEEKNRLLMFHFYENVVMTTDDLACQTKLTSLTGDTSRVKCRRKSAGVYTKYQRGQGNKDLDDYPLIDFKSKIACSGIIHRLDHVLLPIVFDPFKDLLVDAVAEETEEEEEPTIIAEEEKEEPEPEEDETEPPEEEEPAEEESVEEEPEQEEVVTDAPEEEEPEEEEEELSLTDDAGDQTDETVVANPHTLDGVDFGREDGCRDCVTGTDIEVTEVTQPGIEQTVQEAEKVEEEKKGPRIGALGINLIIFSTLLLCFVFVCMRR